MSAPTHAWRVCFAWLTAAASEVGVLVLSHVRTGVTTVHPDTGPAVEYLTRGVCRKLNCRAQHPPRDKRVGQHYDEYATMWSTNQTRARGPRVTTHKDATEQNETERPRTMPPAPRKNLALLAPHQVLAVLMSAVTSHSNSTSSSPVTASAAAPATSSTQAKATWMAGRAHVRTIA